MRGWSDDYPIDKHMADLYWCQLLIWPTLMGPFHLELRFLDVWLTTSSLQVDMWTSSTNLDFGQLVQWRPLLRRVPQDLNACTPASQCCFNDDKPSSLWTDVKLYKLTEKLQIPYEWDYIGKLLMSISANRHGSWWWTWELMVWWDCHSKPPIIKGEDSYL